MRRGWILAPLLLAALLVLCLLCQGRSGAEGWNGALPRALRYTQETCRMARELIAAYASGEDSGKVRSLLGALQEADSAAGELWRRIMAYWDYVGTRQEIHCGRLPHGLPADDTLCLVVLGYALSSDGEMQPELTERCRVALACAEQYPRARILLTGGSTSGKVGATEAGAMADWLEERGVRAERILIEDRARTTADNGVLGVKLLRERAPQVRKLAIISSDYHIAVSSLIFYAVAQKDAIETGAEPYEIVSNAACPVPSKAGTQGVALQATFLRSAMDLKPE